MVGSKLWSAQEQQVLIENYGNIKKDELLMLLPGRTKQGISWQATIRGLKSDRSITNRRLAFDGHDYFATPTMENCYWAGFIAADGCVSEKRGVLYLYQAARDVIERFSACIGHNGKISCRTRQNGSTEYCLSITSKKIVSDLRANFNVVGNKTRLLEPPIGLKGDRALAYIVGYLDGDGHISWINNRRKGTRHLVFGILGTLSVTSWMREILGLGTKVQRRTDCKSPLYLLRVTGKPAIRILRRLLGVAGIEHLRLRRKWDKVPVEEPCLES